MKTNHPIILAISACLFASPVLLGQTYRDASAPVEDRVSDLISRMTLEEKVWQLNQAGFGNNRNINNIGEKLTHIPAEIGSLIYTDDDVTLRNAMQRKAVEDSRLGIPILFGYDVIHGFRTVYPISLAQACSWNPDLAREASRVAAREASGAGIDWTFSPMIDVARDPRWGRVAEGYGEDPYTNAIFAVGAVKGYQGDNLADEGTVAACLKHYIGYGASEGGRDYSCTDISDQAMWDTYMPPYQAGVKAGAATVMSSFNDINGIPATANRFLLTDVLKQRWNFDGFVVSDWNAVEQLVSQGIAADRAAAAAVALYAGVDMDMGSNAYGEHMVSLVESGIVSMDAIDASVARILALKFRLGLFEHPYTTEIPESQRVLLDSDRTTARRLAEESMVLLKNTDDVLPLRAGTTVALIGPMADNRGHLLGSWPGHGRDEDIVSVVDGLSQRIGNSKVLFSRGCDFEGTDTTLFAEALATAGKADVVVLCLGEKREWSGENASRASMELPGIQKKLLAALNRTGKPIVLVLTNGRPLILTDDEPYCSAIVEMWQPGIEGGNALAALLCGDVAPSGKLAMTFPRHVGQVPIYYNERPRARRDQGFYQDIPTEPLYPFAYGLSYTSFEYSDLGVEKQADGTFRATVRVTNTGSRDAAETVHWFISDPASSISRPARELKYFEKRMIPAGNSAVFVFDIDPVRDLAFVNSHGMPLFEAGAYIVSVNGQSVEINLAKQ